MTDYSQVMEMTREVCRSNRFIPRRARVESRRKGGKEKERPTSTVRLRVLTLSTSERDGGSRSIGWGRAIRYDEVDEREGEEIKKTAFQSVNIADSKAEGGKEREKTKRTTTDTQEKVDEEISSDSEPHCHGCSTDVSKNKTKERVSERTTNGRRMLLRRAGRSSPSSPSPRVPSFSCSFSIPIPATVSPCVISYPA